MTLTESQSARLKMRLKHEPVTDELRRLALTHPIEADEALEEVQNGHDSAHERSWVAEQHT